MMHHYTRAQIDALLALTGGTAKARQILDALGAASGVAYLRKTDEVNFAHHLLSERHARIDVVSRLMKRFNITERTAWRRCSAALKKPLT